MMNRKKEGLLRSEIKEYKVHFIIAISSILVFFSLPVFLSDETVFNLGMEDALIENLTAVFFLLSSVMFLVLLIRTRHIIYLVFFLVFFFGGAEEISWGQRIFNYNTPESIEERNVQREFNFHNLEMFSSYDSEGAKEGIARFLNFYTAFTLFWFAYCIVLPLVLPRIRFISKMVDLIRLPVPPLLLGLPFLLNYVTHEVIIAIIQKGDKMLIYGEYFNETYEMCPAIFFFLITLVFYQRSRRPRVNTAA